MNKQSFACCVKSLDNISQKNNQCAFSNDETVTDLAAVSPGVMTSQSHTSGAVCERTLWLTSLFS